MNSFGFEYGPVTGSCEHGKDPLGSTEDGLFIA
jgi:hypothetical protein